MCILPSNHYYIYKLILKRQKTKIIVGFLWFMLDPDPNHELWIRIPDIGDYWSESGS